MPPFLRKVLLVFAGLLIAAAITYLPWAVLWRLTGPISSLYGMTAILWAPLALIIGIVAGRRFVRALWPREA